MSRQTRPRALDPNKKLRIERYDTQSFGLEEDAAETHAGGKGPAVRIDLPVPDVRLVADYDQLYAGTYTPSLTYVRRSNVPMHDIYPVDYDADEDDAAWVHAHAKFGDAGEERLRVTVEQFAQIVDILEKESGRIDGFVTMAAAETKCFELVAGLVRPGHSRFISDVYGYWMKKRERLHKPLLRRYWPVTAPSDTNPHHVFRPREKEAYKLRNRARRNDGDSLERMTALRSELERVRDLADIVVRREKLKQHVLAVEIDRFDQELYEATDTSGKPRRPRTLLPESFQLLKGCGVRVPKAAAAGVGARPGAKKRDRSGDVKHRDRSGGRRGGGNDAGEGGGAAAASAMASVAALLARCAESVDPLGLVAALGLPLQFEYSPELLAAALDGRLNSDDAGGGAAADVSGIMPMGRLLSHGVPWERRDGARAGVDAAREDSAWRFPPAAEVPVGVRCEGVDDVGDGRRAAAAFVTRARVGRGGRVILDHVPITPRTVGYCTGGGMLGYYASGAGGGGAAGSSSRDHQGLPRQSATNGVSVAAAAAAAAAATSATMPPGGASSGAAGSAPPPVAASYSGGVAVERFGADRPPALDAFGDDGVDGGARPGGTWDASWSSLARATDPFVALNGLPAGSGVGVGVGGGSGSGGRHQVDVRRVEEILAQADSDDEGMIAMSYLGATGGGYESDVDFDLPIPAL